MRATLLRLDEKTYKQLKIRAMLEKRSMTDIIREAIAVHFEIKPIDQEKFREYLAESLKENKEILEALARP